MTRRPPKRVPPAGGVGLEITALHETQQSLAASEELHRRLVEASPDLIGVAVQGRVVFINSAGARMLGAASPATLIGRPVIEFVHPDSRPQAADNIRRILEQGKSTPLGVERWLRVDGAPITVELSAFPHRYQNQPAIYIVAQDVTRRVQTEEQLREYAGQLHAMSHRIVEAQEKERQHLARELHDEIGQELTALQITLQMAAKQTSPDHQRDALEEGLKLLDGLVQKTQDLSLRLRPSILDDLGLASALRWFLNLQATRAKLRVTFQVEPLRRRLEPELETACFRIAQEAVTNVLRHARARAITLQLQRESGQLHLVVRDDGVGMKSWNRSTPLAKAGHLGLLGMQERAALAGGRVEFLSARGQGTEVHAWLPLRWRKPVTSQPTP